MKKLMAAVVTTIIVAAAAFAPSEATAAPNAALQKAKADCKAQVKEFAKYNETYRYQRYKMVKKCVADSKTKS